MSSSDLELQKMVRGFRVTDLQSLLIYAGRTKVGKKSELQNRALDLIKLHSDSINMKIRELHLNRSYQQGRGHLVEPERSVPSSRHSNMSNIDMDPLGARDNGLMSSKHYGSSTNHQGSMGMDLGLTGYVPPWMNPRMPSMPELGPLQRYPVNPDVQFKDLPFYDVLADLLKPTSLVQLRGDGLVQEKELHFFLRPQDQRELDSASDVQVQLRIGCLESNRDQEDEFPTSICIKVNQRIAQLPNPIPTNKPGQDPKRPKRPVDITYLIKRTTSEPQVLCVSWASNNNKPYVVGVFLVRKQNSSVLIKRLKDMGVRNPDHTTAMIKEKMCNRDSEIAFMSLKGSLMCPLGKIKMQLPCRAITCTHLQCFDATLYVQMNEKKPKWICPVCDKPAEFKNLAIDGLFLDIACKAPPECTEVQFHENGSWTPLMPVKKAPEVHQTITPEAVKTVESKPSQKKKTIEVISLDSDSDTEESWAITAPPKKKPYKPTGVVNPISIDIECPVVIEETVRKFPDLLQPGPSKTLSSASTSSVDNSGTSGFSSYGPRSTTPSTFSQTSTSEPSSYQGTSNASTNSSGSAGQCANDFDLYSLILPNSCEIQLYDENTPPNDPIPQEDVLDIISIDD